MALYFITGISGSGKTTVLSELRNRGYEAYDVDEAGPATAKWHNDATGYIHPKSSVKQEDRTPEFLAQHSWKVPRAEVIDLAQNARTKDIFLGGSISNESELSDLFSRVFALIIDDKTLTHRLKARTNNDWGKSSHELNKTIAANRGLEECYQKLGYVIIDATQPSDVIALKIVGHLNEDK